MINLLSLVYPEYRWISQRWSLAGNVIICPTDKPCYALIRFYKKAQAYCGCQCARKFSL